MTRFVMRVPDLGEGSVSAEVIAWKVAAGDTVREDAPLVESVDIDAWAKTADARLPVESSLDLIAALHLRWVELLRGASPADLERTWHVRADPAPRTAWRLARCRPPSSSPRPAGGGRRARPWRTPRPPRRARPSQSR
jgi:hypothetical protein